MRTRIAADRHRGNPCLEYIDSQHTGVEERVVERDRRLRITVVLVLRDQRGRDSARAVRGDRRRLKMRQRRRWRVTARAKGCRLLDSKNDYECRVLSTPVELPRRPSAPPG